MIYLQLFVSYLKIGFFGFGGGYAMLSLIQNEIVINHEWITMEEFTDIVALSQMTPGPIAVNSATYVGFHVGGILGSAIATIAVCLPALTLMLLVTRFYLKLKDNSIVKGTINTIHPVIVGMILAAVFLLIFPQAMGSNCFIDIYSWILFALAVAASIRKVNPFLIIIAGAIIGIVVYS